MLTTSERLIPAASPERAAMLRAQTAPMHERLDQRIMELRPFESVQRYTAFVRGQLAFQHRIEAMYRDPELQEFIPGLADRSRLAALEADLADLGQSAPAGPGPIPPYEPGEALGWLYVSEGSTLGSAFLLKEVQKLGLGAERGARHMAAHPEGRGLHWRRFVEQLNAAGLRDAEDDAVVSGARTAFSFVRDAFEIEFAKLSG